MLYLLCLMTRVTSSLHAMCDRQQATQSNAL
jgi:hypothetical protein